MLKTIKRIYFWYKEAKRYKNIKKTIWYGMVSFFVYLVPFLIYLKGSNVFFTAGGEGLFILQRYILGGVLFFPLVYFAMILFLI